MQLGGGVNDQCGYHCLRGTISLWVKPTDQKLRLPIIRLLLYRHLKMYIWYTQSSLEGAFGFSHVHSY